MSANFLMLVAFAICVLTALAFLGKKFQVVGIILAGAVTLFCAFGFLASFEPGEGHIYFTIAYASTGGLSFLIGVWLLASKPA